MTVTALAWYLYCIVPAGENPALEGLAGGVDPSGEVGCLTEGELSAVVSHVRASDSVTDTAPAVIGFALAVATAVLQTIAQQMRALQAKITALIDADPVWARLAKVPTAKPFEEPDEGAFNAAFREIRGSRAALWRG